MIVLSSDEGPGDVMATGLFSGTLANASFKNIGL